MQAPLRASWGQAALKPPHNPMQDPQAALTPPHKPRQGPQAAFDAAGASARAIVPPPSTRARGASLS